jgi:glycosyltransferase involved in cell wall biosynthesis
VNPASSDSSGRERRLASEVRGLRQAFRVVELNTVRQDLVAQQFRQLSGSRLFPAALLVLKVSVVAERLARRALGKPPSPVLSPRVTPRPDDTADEGVEEVAPPRGARAALVALSKGLRLLAYATRTLVKGPGGGGPAGLYDADPYGLWVAAFNTADEPTRRHLRRRVEMMSVRPRLSVVMATYNTDHRFLTEALASVTGQIYPDFELVVADDCSPDPEVREIVRRVAASDPRVRLVERATNGGISAATNSAIEAATGDWVVFMDHDDTLAEYALLHVALAIEARPGIDLLYSDEDKIDEHGRPFTPYFKSDFDPLLLYGQNYVCHLTTVRRRVLDEVGPLRSEFDGAQDWDLVLRVTEAVGREAVFHIPLVLYHWRSHQESTSRSGEAKPWALDAGRRCVAAALERRGVAGRVEAVEGTGFARVRFDPPEDPPLVSVLIPTRDGRYLGPCLETLLAQTTYPNFEVLVIDNGSVKPETAEILARHAGRVRVHRDERPFNYSQLHNDAVPEARGEVLVLLNDDTEVVDGQWLGALVAQVLQPGVGVVGARLLYGDGRVQHAGVVLGPNGLVGHVGQFRDRLDKGYFGRSALASEFQAVTAACLAVRRATWERLGGLDEALRVAFNDIDFCLRVRESGEAVTYTPLAELVHHESVSRGFDRAGEAFTRFTGEVLEMRDRWGPEILDDPYYNPNLTRGHDLYELAYPPRVSPWFTGIE